MSIETRCHTALHILKGAIVNVLGPDAKWSTSAGIDGNHGRIAVEFNRKPTDEELALIQVRVDEKLAEDAEIEIHNLSRKDAEKRWGDWIYDKFPLPESIQQLSVFHLPDWNVNACNKKHTKTTGEVGKIQITKTRYRNSKNVLEVSYDVI
ncbi:alanyl-tRNA editing protein [Candidatus Bathyarchaeota archaeon]|nr:alanyl-tRNA editing protein [Candidatus Bathyarchaeota archaeon]